MPGLPRDPPEGMYRATTAGVTVRVWTAYEPRHSDPAREIFSFTYAVEVENGRQDQVQLTDREWKIADGSGRLQVVKGPGVVGEQPLIAPGGRFSYSSGCQLRTPTGSMRGAYRMMGADGAAFEARIPGFPLRASHLN